jgi:hypothetical protein
MRVMKVMTVLVAAASLACSSSGSSSGSSSSDKRQTESIEQEKNLTRYRGPELEVEVNYWWAQRHLGDELLLLKVAFMAGRTSSLVKLENIRARTPDGHAIPPMDQIEFHKVYGQLRMALSQSNAWAGPTFRFMGSRGPCGRWFVSPPGALSPRYTEIYPSRSQVCFGPLVFQVPAGIQPGPWALTIDLEETQAKVPFKLELPADE